MSGQKFSLWLNMYKKMLKILLQIIYYSILLIEYIYIIESKKADFYSKSQSTNKQAKFFR